jgi:uncharacterized protein (DUF433 family)
MDLIGCLVEEFQRCLGWIIAMSKRMTLGGGQPVIAGTRLRVATILASYRQGMGVEEIVQQYPGLRPADVHDALAYAYDHMDEIDASLVSDDEALVKAHLLTGDST